MDTETTTDRFDALGALATILTIADGKSPIHSTDHARIEVISFIARTAIKELAAEASEVARTCAAITETTQERRGAMRNRK
ncbi:MAG TPA: hypothetical protein VIV57_13075 [Anaeromyxobacter sp.]